jgi:hypothetical protein
MNYRNKHVLRIHWAFESGRDDGRGMTCVFSIHQCLWRDVEGTVGESIARRFAPGEFLTLHPWEGRCRALAAPWVYFLI